MLSFKDHLCNTLQLKCCHSILSVSAEIKWVGTQRVLGLLSLRDNDNRVLAEGGCVNHELLYMSGMHKDERYGMIITFVVCFTVHSL